MQRHSKYFTELLDVTQMLHQCKIIRVYSFVTQSTNISKIQGKKKHTHTRTHKKNTLPKKKTMFSAVLANYFKEPSVHFFGHAFLLNDAVIIQIT